MRPLLLIVFLSLLFPFSVSAGYYRYVNENGVPCYVDTIGKVPKVYQDQVVYQFMPTSTGKDTDAQKPMGALLKKKMELDDEYTVLMKEKEGLLESIRGWEEKFKTWESKKSALDKN